jgi:hypothetical protein
MRPWALACVMLVLLHPVVLHAFWRPRAVSAAQVIRSPAELRCQAITRHIVDGVVLTGPPVDRQWIASARRYECFRASWTQKE